jgi:hypothetical protein
MVTHNKIGLPKYIDILKGLEKETELKDKEEVKDVLCKGHC